MKRERFTDWSQVPLLLTPGEVAALLDCSRSAVYRHIKTGELEPIAAAGRTYISKLALQSHFGVRPEQADPQVDPQVVHHLERAQYHHNQAMRLLEVE